MTSYPGSKYEQITPGNACNTPFLALGLVGGSIKNVQCTVSGFYLLGRWEQASPKSFAKITKRVVFTYKKDVFLQKVVLSFKNGVFPSGNGVV